MIKKCLVEYRNLKKILHCAPNQLKEKVKENFNLQKLFHLQFYDDDFKEWAEIDLENLPSNPKIKVIIGKDFFA